RRAGALFVPALGHRARQQSAPAALKQFPGLSGETGRVELLQALVADSLGQHHAKATPGRGAVGILRPVGEDRELVIRVATDNLPVSAEESRTSQLDQDRTVGNPSR